MRRHADVASALAALHSALKWACRLAILLLYCRYLAVLGSGTEPEGSPERQAYDALRSSLAEGNLAARLYAERLSRNAPLSYRRGSKFRYPRDV